MTWETDTNLRPSFPGTRLVNTQYGTAIGEWDGYNWWSEEYNDSEGHWTKDKLKVTSWLRIPEDK